MKNVEYKLLLHIRIMITRKREREKERKGGREKQAFEKNFGKLYSLLLRVENAKD